jgi:hypothetical protein
LAIACLLAGSPTSRWPSFVKATIDGNAFPPTLVPSALGMISGLSWSMTAAAELLVPRSIPNILPILSTPIKLFKCNLIVSAIRQFGDSGIRVNDSRVSDEFNIF